MFRKKDEINIFNKKALYYNIKETVFINTGVNINTSSITAVSERLKVMYAELYKKYQNCEAPFDKCEHSVFI